MAYGSFESDGITVQSSEHTSDQLAANLTPAVAVVEPEVPAAPATPDAVVVPPVEKPADKPRNRREDPQEAVKSAIAKQREAERRAADAEARLNALEQPKPAALKASVVTGDAEPTVEQFDSYEKFVDARARWAARQEWDSREQAKATREADQLREHAVREVDRRFYERYSKVLADDPEFESNPALDPRLLTTKRIGVLTPEERQTATLGNVLLEYVFHSEHPKELLLHLSKPDEIQRLATLPPGALTRTLAMFEARLDAASSGGPAPQTPPVSHAKPPIQPLGSSPIATDPNEMTGEESVDDHIRKMNAADRRIRRAS